MAYQYQALSSSNNHIRLLKLFPSVDKSAPVVCELEIVSLSSFPSYSGLSYCWGDIPTPEIVSLHGYDHEVTGNLHAALTSLRDKTRPKFWWIDALCINQDDVEERSLQVQRMTSIYRTATRVVSWIGPEIPGQPDLKRMVEARFFAPILSRKYWGRMWMVQEVSVAIDLWVVCGDTWVNWDVFCDAFDGNVDNKLSTSEAFYNMSHDTQTELIQAAELPYQDLISSRNRLGTFRAFKKRNSEQQSLPFLEALQQTTKFSATDPRDRIYALLGLVHDGRAFVPVPDYTISFENLEVQMAKNYLQATRKLDVILIPGNKHVLDGSVPSWKPHWLDLGFEFWYAMEAQPEQKFKASGTSVFKRAQQDEEDNPHSIRVECVIFAEVDGLSSLYGREATGHKREDHFVQPSSTGANPYAPKDSSAPSNRPLKAKGKARIRNKTIKALFNCLDLGPELTTENYRYSFISTGGLYVKRAMMIYLYYGVASAADSERVSAWRTYFRTNRYKGKRRYDSPELSRWLEDNRDWMIHGATFESLCKSTCSWTVYPHLWTGPFWFHTFSEVILLGLILATIIGSVTQSRSAAFVIVYILLAMDILGLSMLYAFVILFYDNMLFDQATFLKRLDERMNQRSLRLATTRNDEEGNEHLDGCIAMVPGCAMRGDRFAILKGCSTPVLLRGCKDGYQLIGIVYLEGAMEGECMEWAAGKWKECSLY